MKIPAIAESLTAAQVLTRIGNVPTATIVGFGSLLSPVSAAHTCPGVKNFRLARCRGWRRVFGHPAAVFFERGIARPETKEISSLSAEPVEGTSGFVVATFDVPTSELPALLEREEEYNFVEIPFYKTLVSDAAAGDDGELGRGWMCTRSTDEEVLNVRGHRAKYSEFLTPHFDKVSIWDEWGTDSGILPCPVYLRHCLLASRRDDVLKEATDSFINETFLADRETTLSDYLLTEKGKAVMDTRPPPALEGRYSG